MFGNIIYFLWEISYPIKIQQSSVNSLDCLTLKDLTGFVKIGRSDNSFVRKVNLQTGNARILKTIHVSIANQKNFKRRFKEELIWSEREWYLLSNRIKSYILRDRIKWCNEFNIFFDKNRLFTKITNELFKKNFSL